METLRSSRSDAEKAVAIIHDAGGEIVGKTRLQKAAYILEIVGLGEGFAFEYRHYGPFSEELARAVVVAEVQGYIAQEERPATWGGTYSIFRAPANDSGAVSAVPRERLLQTVVKANPVALELAATAAYLAREGYSNPWAETYRRKPDKAAHFLEAAKELYRQLSSIKTPIALPCILD